MKKYLSFFRLRFIMGLQYRISALAGVSTQFAWGFMEIFAFKAFYETSPECFPMTFAATASYIWLQQAFLALFAAWLIEGEIFANIMNGNIAYELCRPINIYNMWFSRSVANRLSKAVLRCLPILIVAAFLPEPYAISAPASLLHFGLFLLALVLGVGVVVAFCMLTYALTFFTISPNGLRILFVSTIEFFTGAIIPLPFFPEKIQAVLELLPFAAMQNVALRIYSANMSSPEMLKALSLQIFWFILLVICGKKLCSIAETKVTVQGG